MLNRLTILLATLLATGLVHAHGTHAGNIHVEQARARASVGNQSNGAAFLTIENQGKADDVLQSVAAPVAGKVEIHTMTMEGDVMKMRAGNRSLNLSNAVAVTVYEAWRQNGFAGGG